MSVLKVGWADPRAEYLAARLLPYDGRWHVELQPGVSFSGRLFLTQTERLFASRT